MPGWWKNKSRGRSTTGGKKKSGGSGRGSRSRKSSGHNSRRNKAKPWPYSRDDLREGAPVKDLVNKVLQQVFRAGVVPGLNPQQADALAADVAEVVRRQALRAKEDVLSVGKDARRGRYG